MEGADVSIDDPQAIARRMVELDQWESERVGDILQELSRVADALERLGDLYDPHTFPSDVRHSPRKDS